MAYHILPYGCLPHHNVLHYGVYSRGFQCRHHQGIFSLPARPMCCCHHNDPTGRLVMEPLQDLQHIPHNHPNLPAVQYHLLIHRLIHHPTGPHRCSPLLQHLHNHPPTRPHFPQFLIHRRPISVFIGDFTPKVREGLRQYQILCIDL